MSVTYGIQVLSSNDPYVNLAEQVVHVASSAGAPGRFLVVGLLTRLIPQLKSLQDTIPALKYVPSWMPGADFKRQAKEWRELSRNFVETPFMETKRNMVRRFQASSELY